MPKVMQTILKPGILMRRAKAKKITDHYDGGQVHCAKCGMATGGATESPTFWENGSYIYCGHCKKATLAKPIYPPSADFPTGLIVDLTGERAKYPLVSKDNPFNPDAGKR